MRTTPVTEQDKGTALSGYTELYGSVPGGQAELLRVPHADFGPIRVGNELPDDRYVYRSDVLPTAWQAVDSADIPEDGSVVVIGLGAIGQMASRVARQRGAGLVIGVDLVPERLAMARRDGIDNIDASAMTGDEVVAVIRHRTAVSVIGVYGGMKHPLPMMAMFDKGLSIRMGQAHVKRWIPDLLPLVEAEDDPLGTMDLATHHVTLDEAPGAYRDFQAKNDGMVRAVITDIAFASTQ